MKKRGTRAIMVAVRELDDSSRLLRKAAAVAKSRRCELRLVHVIAMPYAPSVDLRPALRQAARQIMDESERRLARLAKRPELRGVAVKTTVAWDHPAADGLVRLVLKHRPQMLLAESQRHNRLARVVLTNTDWELIRKCPCPLWISKSRAAGRAGPVLAALDPLHAHAKPASLDRLILRHALDVGDGRPARVLAVHAYSLPAPPVVVGPIEAYWIGMSDEEVTQYESAIRKQIDRLTDSLRIPEANRLLVRGDPAGTLASVARKHRAAVVVMGAVSRSGLARLFIGHTAERVIDALDCDVLIVKPRGFRTSVGRRRPSAPRT